VAFGVKKDWLGAQGNCLHSHNPAGKGPKKKQMQKPIRTPEKNTALSDFVNNTTKLR